MTKRIVRRPRIHRAQAAVVFEGASFDFKALPPMSREYLGLLGLKTAMLISTATAVETYRSLQAGHLPDDKPLTEPRKSKWRQAVASAMAAAKAEQEAVKGARRSVIEYAAKVHLPAMEAHVAKLDADLIKKLMKRDDVQEHYRMLFNPHGGAEQMSLLAMVGVVTNGPKLPEAPSAPEEKVHLPADIEE